MSEVLDTSRVFGEYVAPEDQAPLGRLPAGTSWQHRQNPSTGQMEWVPLPMQAYTLPGKRRGIEVISIEYSNDEMVELSQRASDLEGTWVGRVNEESKQTFWHLERAVNEQPQR